MLPRRCPRLSFPLRDGMRWAWLLVGSLLLALGGGCRTARGDFDPRQELPQASTIDQFGTVEQRAPLDPAMLAPPTQPYRLGVGDLVELEIAEVNGTRTQTFVMPDGRLYFDLAGGVMAEGLTVEELARRLERALAADYAAPRVNASLVEVRSRRVWVLGRVYQPGLFPLDKPTRLLEAIARAGGLATSRFSGTTEELADLTRSFVMRQGQVVPVDLDALLNRGDLGQNIFLEPDDYVYIPSVTSASVSILGRVGLPQAVPYSAKLTLVGALANARGPAPGARLDEVLIVRGSTVAPKVAVVNLAAILNGQASDVLLAPFDIVYVPATRWSRMDDLVWNIIDTAARTIAVREGSNAADYGGQSGVVIPVGSP